MSLPFAEWMDIWSSHAIPWEWESHGNGSPNGFPKKSWIDDHPQYTQYTIQPDHATSWNEDPEKIPTLLRWINVDKYDK